MTDIRTRIEIVLTETLRGDIPLAMDCAAVILSMPGIAHVVLPEADSTREDDEDPDSTPRLGWAASDSAFYVTQWGHPDEVQIAYGCEPMEPLTVAEARALAAALLSAADAVEKSHKDE